MKRDNGKLIFICITVAVVMIAGLYIDSVKTPGVRHEGGSSAFSVEIAPKETPEATPQVVELGADDEVYVTKSGSRFHAVNDCGRMNPENAQKITVKDALDKQLSPCGVCLKNAKIN